MQRAPDDEFPGRAVPEAAEHHGQQQIAVGPEPAVPVAAERDVEIVAQPARQRHVPAPPEVGQRLGPVGLVEVALEAIAEQRRDADGDVAVGAEVAVDLHGVAVDGGKQIDGSIRRRIEEGLVDQAHRQPVGDHGLLEHAPQDQHHAEPDEHPVGIGRALQLRQEARRPHDGARHQMRKERDEEHDVDQRARPVEIAAVEIDDVGDALEGEEGDADRQHDLEQRQLAADLQRDQQRVQLLREPAVVLEESRAARGWPRRPASEPPAARTGAVRDRSLPDAPDSSRTPLRSSRNASFQLQNA